MRVSYRSVLIILTSLFIVQAGMSQSVGYLFPHRTDRVVIPFTLENGFIVIPIKLKGIFPFKFIFDTGSETTIITEPQVANILGMRYTRKFDIVGSDMNSILTAYLIKSVSIDFIEGSAPTQDILVFDRNYFNLEEFIGDNVVGILGADIFKNYVVEIDYKHQQLVIYKKDGFVPSKRLVSFAMHLRSHKPYIDVIVDIHKSKSLKSSMLIDTGAALALLIDADKNKGLELPEKTIKGTLGYGIGGELEGYVGRIQSLTIGEFIFDNLVANFRIFDSSIDSVKIQGIDHKDGLIGNEILRQFKCVFDYPSNMFYMKPYRKRTALKVKFDRSGITLVRVGINLDQIMISHVLDTSPASEGGFQRGDIIKSINRVPSFFLSYEGTIKRFKRNRNKKYRIKIRRETETLILYLTLRDLI